MNTTDKAAAAAKLDAQTIKSVKTMCDALRLVSDVEYANEGCAANLKSYCSLMADIREIVEAAVGRELDINWYGNESFFDDVLTAVFDAFDNAEHESGDAFFVEYVESVHGVDVVIYDALAIDNGCPVFKFDCLTMDGAKAQAAMIISTLTTPGVKA